MKNHLGIRARAESVAFARQLRAQFDVVENLAVERDPDRAVLVRHRLLAAGEVDNAQPRVRQAYRSDRRAARVRQAHDARASRPCRPDRSTSILSPFVDAIPAIPHTTDVE